jgi:hypothetical protein
MPNPFLGDFGTMLRGKCCPASFRDRKSLSGPCPSSYARVVARHDISGTPELVQLAVLTTAWP